jgi:hypothetical protein
MLKFFFWLLLLANGGLLAYQRGAFDAFVSSGHEPARMSNQVNADKVRVVPVAGKAGGTATEASTAAAPATVAAAPEPTPAAAPQASGLASDAGNKAPASAAAPVTPAVPATTATTATTATAAAKTAAPAAPIAAVVEKKPDLNACLEVGNFNAEEAKRFTTQLTTSQLVERATQRTVQEVASHIVYIPPQGDKEAADRKVGELRRLGITDFYVMQDNSPMRWGISLGVFRTEESARAHLAALNLKGVRSARIGQRTVSSSMVAFQFRNLEPEKKWLVEKIKSGFAKQEIRSCEGA